MASEMLCSFYLIENPALAEIASQRQFFRGQKPADCGHFRTGFLYGL